MIKIAYVGLVYNYGKPEEGHSYEFHNIEAGFKEWVSERSDVQVEFFYPDATDGDHMGELRQRVINEEVDAIFHVAFNETLDLPADIARLAMLNSIPVIQWDCDSSWRFENWILPRKDRVSHFVTTHSCAVPWYERNNMRVIRSQWGGSPLYSPDPSKGKKYDVSFIGQKHGQLPDGRFWRQVVVEAIRDAGIDIHLFGNYWDGQPNWHGYLAEFQDMLDVFQTSKICLNLSNPWHIQTMRQIKGRHFEIPQAGSFQLSTPCDDLERYFVPDKEIVIVREDIPALVSSIKHYLSHDEEREAIAAAGYKRMQEEHQWSMRLSQMFEEIGLLK